MSGKKTRQQKTVGKPPSKTRRKDEEEPVPGRNRTSDIVFGLVCLAGLIVSLLIFIERARGVSGMEVDDAGITFAFAQNLAEGYGIVLYPGGERVEGYSNPLWMFLQALGRKFGIEPILTARYLGYLFGGLTLLFLALFAWRGFEGGKNWPGIVVPVFVALHGAFAIWAMSGMETALYIFLIVAASYRLFRECREENPARLPLSPILFFLLSLTRPEGVVFFLLALIYRAAAVIAPRRKVTRADGLWLAFFAVPWLFYQGWHYIYFAWPFANTYYGKVTPRTWSEIFRPGSYGRQYLAGYLKGYGLTWLGWFSLIALAAPREFKSAAYLLAAAGFTFFFPLYAGGDWMPGFRFCAPIAPLLFLSASLAFAALAALPLRLTRNRDPFWRTLTSILAAAAFLLTGLACFTQPGKAQYEAYRERPAARIVGIKDRADYFRNLIGKLRIRDYEASVVDMDMGALSMYSRARLIDVGRICNVAIAHNFFNEPYRARFMDEYVLRQNHPEFAHLRRAWGRQTTLLSNRSFQSDYLLLPPDRSLGRGEQGNFIRKDLILFDHAPESAGEIFFSPGLALLSSRMTPEIVERGRWLWFRLFWRRQSEKALEKYNFRLRFVSPDGDIVDHKPYKPVMGIYPTPEWKAGQIIGEWVRARIPKNTKEGSYRIRLQVLDAYSGQVLDEQPLGKELLVDGHAARQRGFQLLEQSLEAVSLGRIEQALALYDEANEYLQDRLPAEDAGRFAKAFCEKALVIAAAQAMEGDGEKRERILSLAARRYPRYDKIQALLWKRSAMEVAEGRRAMGAGDPERAWRHFEKACRLQPRNAWARRWAEEARVARYRKEGRSENQ